MSFSLKTLKIVGVAALASLSLAGMNSSAQADAQLSGQLSIGIQGSPLSPMACFSTPCFRG